MIDPPMDSLEVLTELHLLLLPQVYLQVGGDAAELARSSSRSVFVDPEPSLGPGLPGRMPWLKVFRMTGVEFFGSFDRDGVLSGGEVELALVDGTQPFATVLGDLANAEQWSSPQGAIVVTNVPPERGSAAPDSFEAPPMTGEGWRLAACLTRFRPRLRLTPIATPGAGLLVIGNLDPGDVTLMRRHAELVGSGDGDEGMGNRDLVTFGDPLRWIDPDEWLREMRRTLLI